jgi:hypothetical protein
MKANHHATRERTSRVALVTCAALPDLDPDDRLLLAPLRRLGLHPVPAVWDDPEVDWSGFALAVLRSTWDYPARRAEFLRWAGSVPVLVHPAPVLAWNTDKRYLSRLARAGVPVVPTDWLPPGREWRPPATGDLVVKPAVSAGSKDTGRYRLDDAGHRRLASALVARLHRQHRMVMIQPYLPAVETYGETALVYLPDGGRGGLAFSHAIRKGPMLSGPDRGGDELYLPEQIGPRTPSPAELAVGRRVLAALPGWTAGLLYARVDLLPGPDAAPLLVELELTEPSLFLRYDPGAATRLATEIGRLARDRTARDVTARDGTATPGRTAT